MINYTPNNPSCIYYKIWGNKASGLWDGEYIMYFCVYDYTGDSRL